jgi:catechol 2,3-dioxygenase-like lactoylglutathione lyase family enzyme
MLPRMFDHVTIRVSDRAASEAFYRTVLSTLGIEPTASSAEFTEWGDFSLAEGPPVTRGLHVAFVAPSRAHVDAFWQAGVDAGHRDDGAPGPRPEYGSDYYGGFLLDPDGNSAEAVHHDTPRSGHVDHLWLRVADLPAVRAFYALIAPYAGCGSAATSPTASSSSAAGRRSRSSPASRPSTCTWPSRRPTTRRWTPSTGRRPLPATPTTGRRASARTITRATTGRSCSTRRATTSRSSATTARSSDVPRPPV